MGVLELMLLSFGALGLASASECVQETTNCSQYWQRIEPHRDFMESVEQLNEWCRKQAQFYECLEGVLLADVSGNVSHLPTNLLISKLFAVDLCTEESTNRRRYLNSAACFNQLNTEFCTQSEYFDIVLPDDSIAPSNCSLAEKTFSCIAAAAILNCGFDAGRVYRNLLKITRYSDEVCGIELSHGIPRCKEEDDNETTTGSEKLSEIYYGLVDRIGSIPEQEVENPEPSTASNNADVSHESDNYEIITQAIKTALDSLDENSSSEDISANESDEDNAKSFDTGSSEQLDRSFKDDLKSPIITQITKGLLFYNYSDEEYAFYWRQPQFTLADYMYCEHLTPNPAGNTIFTCLLSPRYKDTDCPSNELVHEQVTPELIHEIDPDVPDGSKTELGPRPYWMKPVDEDMRGKQSQESKYICESSVDSEADIPMTCYAAFVFLHVTKAIEESPEWKGFDVNDNSNGIFPDDLRHELTSIFMHDHEQYLFPVNSYLISKKVYSLLFNRETNALENLVCNRINECHPKGRGLWKCRAFRRKVETDGTKADAKGSSASYSSQSYSDAKIALKMAEAPDTIEIPVTDSEVLESRLGELVTLVISDDKDSEVNRFDPFYERLIPPANDEFSYLNDAAEDADPKDSDAEDSSFRLMVLQDVNEQLENSSRDPELVYAVNDMEIFDDEQIAQINLSDANYGLLNENVILLRDVSDASNVQPEYAIVNTHVDEYN